MNPSLTPSLTPTPAAVEWRLLNEYQASFPLTPAPFADIGRALGIGESAAMAAFAHLIALGKISRIGAVFPPGAVGVSTLAAMEIPDHDLERVAEIVSARAEVNHNYEREHRRNLWFVATAVDRSRLRDALDSIARQAGYPVVALPLVEQYRIDLGFDLDGESNGTAASARVPAVRSTFQWTRAERLLADVLARGLPVTRAPYARVGVVAGLDEAAVLARIADWLHDGTIRRFGVVVRHRALGFRANAMCVWDVPDAETRSLGERVAREAAVTLCYRRRRAEGWPYNLYCMIHGRDRVSVEREIAGLSERHSLSRYPHAVLFSRRAFKQRGARYGLAGVAAAA